MFNLFTNRRIGCAVALVISATVLAQSHLPINQRIPDFRFEHLTVAQGLSQSTVGYDPLEDIIVRHQKDSSNPFSIGSNTVQATFHERSDGLWVGTAQAGLFYWI